MRDPWVLTLLEGSRTSGGRWKHRVGGVMERWKAPCGSLLPQPPAPKLRRPQCAGSSGPDDMGRVHQLEGRAESGSALLSPAEPTSRAAWMNHRATRHAKTGTYGRGGGELLTLKS